MKLYHDDYWILSCKISDILCVILKLELKHILDITYVWLTVECPLFMLQINLMNWLWITQYSFLFSSTTYLLSLPRCQMLIIRTTHNDGHPLEEVGISSLKNLLSPIEYNTFLFLFLEIRINVVHYYYYYCYYCCCCCCCCYYYCWLVDHNHWSSRQNSLWVVSIASRC